GFTSRMSVVHPPPSAKCGNTAAVAGERRSTTGSVVIRNSERSLTTPRSATAATAFVEANVKDPENAVGPKNGCSFRNAATCSLAAIVVEFEYPSLPFSSVNAKDTTTGSEFGLAMATPLRTDGPVSP